MANVLLGATGSVAAVKVPELFAALSAVGHAVKVVATDPARYFFEPAAFARPGETFFVDADEWPGQSYRRDDPVLHIELRRWAEVFLIAPLDANTLAKLANGLSDNCLTCVWRAWDRARPVVLAPAMNTLMWENPLTLRHLRQLAEDGGILAPPGLDQDSLIEWINERPGSLRFAAPQSKRLACGEVGVGAMASVEHIVERVGEALGSGRTG